MVFWANVRSISQKLGYTERAKAKGETSRVRVPTEDQIVEGMHALGLRSDHLFGSESARRQLGTPLLEYFQYRADVLNRKVQHLLMDVDEAKERFAELCAKEQPKRPFQMNKQKGEKAGPALLTSAIVVMAEAVLGTDACNYDPQQLTTFTVGGAPVRTMSRRVDGAYPATVNPVAIWEVKEYYYTTTFGSRVADGVYESLLDGLELEELAKAENIQCKHYLFVDSHFTWWVKGRSYLCRLIDMMCMGYVDEVVFGSEVYERVPNLAREWQDLVREDQP